MKTIAVEINSPEKNILKEAAEFLAVPGIKGEIGILPGHTRLLAQLSRGKIRLLKDNQMKFLIISPGFMVLHPEKAEIFVENAEIWVQSVEDSRP